MSSSLEDILLELLRIHGVSLLVGLLVFGAGMCTGILVSGTVSNKKQTTISSPKHVQRKPNDEPKAPASVELSPVKLLHRIASNFLRSSAQSNPKSAVDYADSADLARNELYKLLGLTSDNQASLNVNWQHVFSNTETQFWVSSSTRSGIQLRGETFVDASACSVVNWLLQQDCVTGIEGLGGKTEVLSRTSTDNEIIIVRKMYCKAGSGIMSSKRDFKLVTSITMQDDGTYVIATRSGSWDFETASTGGGSSSNSAAGDSQRSDLSKGYIRGIVYASGFILRPIVEDDHVGCAMSFGCHVDMKGTRSGRGNTANVNLILASILRVIKCIQNGEADQFNHLDGQSLRYIDQIGSWGKTLGMSHSMASQGELATADAEPNETNENESAGDLLVKLHIPTQQLFNASLPTTADKYKLLSVARDAANRLRAQYHDTVGPDNRGVLPRTSFSGPPEIRRETFYEQDGIVLKEIHKDYVSPFGVFSATFQVQAAPEAVKKLLVFRPDSIDGFLEGRSILNYLSPETYVQWMAYGALFPLTAKDLLLVTTMEPWEKKDSRSFVIASTSIDNMCEISRPVRDSISSNSGGDAGPVPKYTRANLRLGGYIGFPNEDGSTTLTFMIDMPLEAQKSSAWLMRYLAQYALTELVGRIRHAVSPFNLSVDRSLFPASHAHGAESDNKEAEEAGSPRFLGGGGTRTADLGKLLASIQRREQGVAKRSHAMEHVPVAYHRRDRTNSVEYYNPADEPAGESRSRLDSDQSVGYSTWKEVRSRANSTIAQNSGDDGPSNSGGGRGRGSSIEGRAPPHRQAAAYPPPPPSSAFALQEPGGIASGSPTRTKEKSQSTFSMLKRSLGKKSKHSKKVVTPSGASSLYMANIADEDSDYNLGTPGSTPSSSPRTGQHKSIPFPMHNNNSSSVPASPYEEAASPSFASMVPSRLRRASRGGGGGDEVDYDSVQRVLGKISPSRRPSKTTQAMRRRSISQAEELRNSVDGPSGGSERTSMGAAPRGGHHRSQSTGDALLQLGQPASNAVLAAHLSQSMNDLPAASEKRASDELTQSAWSVYRTYFDPEMSRKQLGIEWQLKLNKPNIHIYSSMVENNSWCAIKAVTIMHTTPMALVEVLLNYDRMGEYDAMFKASKLVQRVDSNTVIQRLMFKEVWPTAPRDFVVCASWRQNDDGSVSIVSRSAPDTLCAQEKGYVRGFLQVSGYLLEPYNPERPVSVPLSCASDGVLAPGQCKVTLLNHTELGGTLPASVINVLSTNAPMKILATLSDIVSTK